MREHVAADINDINSLLLNEAMHFNKKKKEKEGGREGRRKKGGKEENHSYF